jgi:hypothetical protein
MRFSNNDRPSRITASKYHLNRSARNSHYTTLQHFAQVKLPAQGRCNQRGTHQASQTLPHLLDEVVDALEWRYDVNRIADTIVTTKSIRTHASRRAIAVRLQSLALQHELPSDIHQTHQPIPFPTKNRDTPHKSQIHSRISRTVLVHA